MLSRDIQLWITDDIDPNENVVINDGWVELKFIYLSQDEYDRVNRKEIFLDEVDDYDDRVIYKSYRA
jgi:hypothetical protein